MKKLDQDLRQAGGKGFFAKRASNSNINTSPKFKFSRRKSRGKHGAVFDKAGKKRALDGLSSENRRKKTTPRFNKVDLKEGSPDSI